MKTIKIILIMSIITAFAYATVGVFDQFVMKIHEDSTITKSRGVDGVYDFGIVQLDSINAVHDAIRMEKMFPDEVGNSLSLYYRVFFDDDLGSISSVADDYEDLGAVVSIELVTPIEMVSTHPDDPMYNWGLNNYSGSLNQEQWYLYNDGDMDDDNTTDGLTSADIQAPEAWDIQTGRTDVVLSLTDTELQWNHDDIEDNLWINPGEDDGNNGFEDWSVASNGDLGDLNGDGYPGVEGVDDDGDGYTDFADPAVYEIYTNGLDNDKDGTTEDELGGDLDDSPGTPGVDDDGDGVVDDYDGAIWDDDENGYVDDVIGFDFEDVHWDVSAESSSDYYYGHGTAVAGDMTAVGNNGVGISGVSWNSKIMMARIGGFYRVQEAIRYCGLMGADVHNMSWVGPTFSTLFTELYDDMNVVLTGGSGNGNESNPRPPASDSNVIAAGGTDAYNQKYYVNGLIGSAENTELSAAHAPITILRPPNTYRDWGSGTSHSAPIIAGVAGLVISELLDQGYTDYTADLVREIMQYTALDLDPFNVGESWYGDMGYGLVQAADALELIGDPPSIPTGFDISTTGDHPYLTWDANDEPDFDHYDLNIYYRELSPPFNTFTETVDVGTSTSHEDVRIDVPGRTINAKYKVRAVDIIDNNSSYTAIKSTNGSGLIGMKRAHEGNVQQIPEFFDMSHAFPNPFNPSTTIRYELPKTSDVTITIYDLMGRRIWVHNAMQKPAGYYSVKWYGTNSVGLQVPSGIYLISLSTNEFRAVQKAVLIR